MRCPTLDQLPPPPPGRTGWPWTAESEQLPDTMPGGDPWPRVSIVTPSYNQGQFIEETIRSVLLQGYPDLEYIIIDGGSTDESVEIIRKYEPWLAYWVTEADNGQAHAINKGFQWATGEIMAYLNSDDLYYPSVVAMAIKLLAKSDDDILIGAIDHVRIDGDTREFIRTETTNEGRPAAIHQFRSFKNGRRESLHFIQPGMFWKRDIGQKAGGFDTQYKYIFDREWFTRALALGASVTTTDEVISRFALHPGSKTVEFEESFYDERMRMWLNLSKKRGLFRRFPCILEYCWGWLHFNQLKNYHLFRRGKGAQAYYHYTYHLLFHFAKELAQIFGPLV